MSILKELLGLTDPNMLFEADVPLELKDVVKSFPKHHAKALSKLWGGQRLVWHGMKFFDDDALGAAYVKAEKAAMDYVNDGYNTDGNIEISDVVNGEEYNETLTWDVTFGDDLSNSMQECYLGYDPEKDLLYIGYDAWASDEDFNSAFDKTFEDMTGEEHDMDNPEHQKIFHDAWEEYKSGNYGFWGLIFEISFDGENMTAEEALPPMTDGFYKGTFKLFKRQHPNVIDLRLD